MDTNTGEGANNTLSQAFSLGVLDLVPRLNGASAEQALQQSLTLAQQAEAWGYTRYWTSEHHDMDELASASPEVLLAHIGARTNSIQLGSGAVLLPHYSPLKVAESFRLLGALYPGRIELGLGRAPGGGPHATMALSGNYLQHVSKLPESLAALTELLEDRYTYEEHPVSARPIPERPISLWMLGTNVKSAEFAAQFGMGYVFGQFMSDADGTEAVRRYREGFKPSKTMHEPRVMVAVSALCAETEAEAQAWSREMTDRRKRSGQAVSALPSTKREYDNNTNNNTPNSEARGMDDGEARKHFAGTAPKIWEQLSQVSERLETKRFLVVTAGPDYERRLKSYRLLAEAGKVFV
ncbi:MsnO8 family LLM class oxidoreductase [Paenibacillus xylanilyticus]|uniref:MsnO8 family LLM class oxidoreductase n=1 Tax=Paenibacillus xylanilyticus TaxID=248903 RepID=A0A7Y6C1P5_9BACL|nr:MsnO8 family LLM class oxidoreductase [Paenibacillus xylanilyticus]NUU78556.1 MsnO8 family LLM class oxidoreductase [Paenibacillus xylanilyticus]